MPLLSTRLTYGMSNDFSAIGLAPNSWVVSLNSRDGQIANDGHKME
jgi:hypothetical protein